MLMPVFVVKSFDSSTRALAGSHAAQHKVRSLALAAPPIARPALKTAPSSDRCNLLMNSSVRAALNSEWKDCDRAGVARRRAGFTSSPDRGQGARRANERPRSLD